MPSPILTITRTLTNGGKISVGRVGEGSAGIYFQWEEEYLRTHPKGNLSPFRVPFRAVVIRGSDHPNHGLHGFLADRWLGSSFDGPLVRRAAAQPAYCDASGAIGLYG